MVEDGPTAGRVGRPAAPRSSSTNDRAPRSPGLSSRVRSNHRAITAHVVLRKPAHVVLRKARGACAPRSLRSLHGPDPRWGAPRISSHRSPQPAAAVDKGKQKEPFLEKVSCFLGKKSRVDLVFVVVGEGEGAGNNDGRGGSSVRGRVTNRREILYTRPDTVTDNKKGSFDFGCAWLVIFLFRNERKLDQFIVELFPASSEGYVVLVPI